MNRLNLSQESVNLAKQELQQFCHAVRMLLCLQQIYTFYLVATSQVFICSGEAMIDFLFQMSSFFSTTLRRCS